MTASAHSENRLQHSRIGALGKHLFAYRHSFDPLPCGFFEQFRQLSRRSSEKNTVSGIASNLQRLVDQMMPLNQEAPCLLVSLAALQFCPLLDPRILEGTDDFLRSPAM